MASKYESKQRQADMEDAQRFREFMPNKNHDIGNGRIENRRAHKERKMWDAQRALLQRKWG